MPAPAKRWSLLRAGFVGAVVGIVAQLSRANPDNSLTLETAIYTVILASMVAVIAGWIRNRALGF